MYKILFGILFGVFFTLGCIFMWRSCWLHNTISKPIPTAKLDTSKAVLLQTVTQLSITNTNFEEKFSAINKRLDDFLLFGGIIITLLLAVTVSVYLKTEAEVSKHFDEHFGKHIKRISEYESEAGFLLGRIRTSVDSAQKMITQAQQTIPQNDTDNGQGSTSNG